MFEMILEWENELFFITFLNGAFIFWMLGCFMVQKDTYDFF